MQRRRRSQGKKMGMKSTKVPGPKHKGPRGGRVHHSAAVACRCGFLRRRAKWLLPTLLAVSSSIGNKNAVLRGSVSTNATVPCEGHRAGFWRADQQFCIRVRRVVGRGAVGVHSCS
eukprot:gene20158-biopygen13077